MGTQKIILLFLAALILPVSVAGATTLNLNQSKIRLSVPPGSSRSGTIQVENPGSTDILVKAYLEDWVYAPQRDGTKEFFPADSARRSASSWIKFVPAEFIIPALGSQTLNYTVNVPPGVSGGYYSVLFFETPMNRSGEEGVGMNLIVRIGSIFYIETGNTVELNGEFGQLSLDRNNLKLEFKNTGNSDITTAGTFHIMDSKGMIFDRGVFADSYTLPGDGASLTAPINQKFEPGTYDLVMTFDLGKARTDADMQGGPVVVKETKLTVNQDGSMKAGELQ